MTKIHDKIIAALKRQKTMEKAIELLRSLDFRFKEPFTIHDLPERLYRYTFMVYKSKRGWDYSLIFGIKMWGKKNSKIMIVQSETLSVWDCDENKKCRIFEEDITIRIPWKDKADINFRKIVVKLKFPEYLNYDERRKWRTEYHKQKNNPKRIPSEWYLKILPDIKLI